MISIKKDIVNIPEYLKSHWAESAFAHNQAVGKFEKGDYAHDDIKNALQVIYNQKCAYCEDDLRNQFSQVEHFRPKSIYPWLGLSWGNLLLSCEICNNSKSNVFQISAKKRSTYNGEKLNELHCISTEYDKSEEPLLINPENETAESLKEHFTFEISTAQFVAKTERMKYTIETCDLNRDGLCKIRLSIRNQIVNQIQTYALLPSTDKVSFTEYIENLFNTKESFSAWKNFIRQIILS